MNTHHRTQPRLWNVEHQSIPGLEFLAWCSADHKKASLTQVIADALLLELPFPLSHYLSADAKQTSRVRPSDRRILEWVSTRQVATGMRSLIILPFATNLPICCNPTRQDVLQLSLESTLVRLRSFILNLLKSYLTSSPRRRRLQTLSEVSVCSSDISPGKTLPDTYLRTYLESIASASPPPGSYQVLQGARSKLALVAKIIENPLYINPRTREPGNCRRMSLRFSKPALGNSNIKRPRKVC